MDNHPYEAHYQRLLPALISKVEELRLYGYETADVPTLWDCLLSRNWKNSSQERSLSRLVGDILSVKAGDYMNFMQISAFKTAEWGEPVSREELDFLFDSRKEHE